MSRIDPCKILVKMSLRKDNYILYVVLLFKLCVYLISLFIFYSIVFISFPIGTFSVAMNFVFVLLLLFKYIIYILVEMPVLKK